MILLFNVIGLVVALIGVYFIYYFHKQSKLYTDSVVPNVTPVVTENQKLLQADFIVNKTIPVSTENTKSFEQVITQHLHNSIKSYINTAAIDKTLAINLNKVSIKDYEDLKKDLKFLNPSDLDNILYKTHFSKEIFKNWSTIAQKERSSYILELYSELFKSLSLYEMIINNSLKNDIDIFHYNVKAKNFLFHIDIPESKLNEVVIYPNPNKDNEQEFTAEIS